MDNMEEWPTGRDVPDWSPAKQLAKSRKKKEEVKEQKQEHSGTQEDFSRVILYSHCSMKTEGNDKQQHEHTNRIKENL